jgi:beta-phosphoglucomutase-like phosphatase (HAD superfamily)
MSEAIAAVVFDLDGVLVDSETVWDAARGARSWRTTAGAGKPTRRER